MRKHVDSLTLHLSVLTENANTFPPTSEVMGSSIHCSSETPLRRLRLNPLSVQQHVSKDQHVLNLSGYSSRTHLWGYLKLAAQPCARPLENWEAAFVPVK